MTTSTPPITAHEISSCLRSLADPVRAAHSARYFRTEPGEYGAGDRFLGIRVPVIRAQVKKFEAVALAEVRTLLGSVFHEERLCALLLLVRKFERGDEAQHKTIFELYLDNLRHINNWDLVDSSASQIVGGYLSSGDRKLLYQLARSERIWDRRIAIIATFYFIRDQQFDDALNLALLLLHDREDLIHKAVGWMLREIGKRDAASEKAFLQAHGKDMPRTMLRYAIEKFPEPERKQYLSSKK